MFCIVVTLFVFNDTATTEIYTYLHTLSLHDALPISTHPVADVIHSNITSGERAHGCHTIKHVSLDHHNGIKPRIIGDDVGAIEFILDIAPRSEEHTSELQSLMRISYAVFCLKKKNKNNNI